MSRFHVPADDTTNPFHSTTPQPQHRPGDVYNPQPFPLSPTGGNPWQPAQPYTPPPPGSMRMPEPVVNGVPVRSHGSPWSSDGGHTNSWDVSGESGDITSQGSQGVEYQHEFMPQPTTWMSEDRRQNAWDEPYPIDEPAEAPAKPPARAPGGSPARSPAMTPAKTPAKPPAKPSSRQSPYRFAGTRYATSDGDEEGERERDGDAEEARGDIALPVAGQRGKKSRKARKDDGDGPYMGGSRQLPSSKRFWLRVFQLIAAVGRFGFQAGASPFSGEPIPPELNFDLAAFYMLYVVAWITICLSIFHTVIYLKRRFGRGDKVKRAIIVATDVAMAVLWGACVVTEIIKNRCPPGSHHNWCDFYNIAIFWGSFAFALFVLAVGWDVWGACSNKRQRDMVV